MAQSLGPTPSRVLLVEGVDDKHVARHVWQRQTAEPPFCIKEKDSVDKLLKAIEVEVKASGLQALGIMLDANTNPAGRWEAVKDRLARVNINLPDSLCASGAIIESHPRVGVWLMPDNTSPGELDHGEFVQLGRGCDHGVLN